MADILSQINPVFRIILIVVLTVAAHFAVKAIRRFSQYLFKLWPGQMKIIEEKFEERVVQILKKSYSDYAAWMVTVTYKVE